MKKKEKWVFFAILAIVFVCAGLGMLIGGVVTYTIPLIIFGAYLMFVGVMCVFVTVMTKLTSPQNMAKRLAKIDKYNNEVENCLKKEGLDSSSSIQTAILDAKLKQTIKCKYCGARIEPNQKFCSNCGAGREKSE